MTDFVNYHVKDLHADLHNCFSNFGEHSTYDFQVWAEYVHPTKYKIVVRRLDNMCQTGWPVNLQVMTCNKVTSEQNTHPTIIHNVTPSNEHETIMEIDTEYEIEPSEMPVERLEQYQMIRSPEPRAISRQEFNEKFNTELVTLPSNIFATGLQNGEVFMYNTEYGHYHESIQQIKHVISVMLTKNLTEPRYFLFCGDDGYMEGHYLERRTIPRYIGEDEYVGHRKVILTNPEEYPVLHRNKYVLTQSQHLYLPYAIGIADRHYFYCNLYHKFRSFHRGIPFHTKIPKIVYAGRPERGTKWNFTERRDIEVHPRQYFWSDAVDKTNIFTSDGHWIDSTEMVNYKYILDIDGRAATWDATAWKLNSGSVIFKQDSPWRQWFYDEFLPWVHYVPVKNDFSDIQEQFQWAETHQEECKKMVDRCMDLFQKTYRFQNVVEHTEQVCSVLSQETST